LIYQQVDGSVVNQYAAFIHSMQMIGVPLLVLMAALKFVKIYLDELNDIPATTTILGVAVELILATVFLFNYTWFAEIFPSLFLRLTQSIQASYETSLSDQVIASMKAVGGEQATEIKWFSVNFWLASIPAILSNLAAMLAMALYWVMSKAQALYYTFWYLVGPILIPFYLFPPFRGVAERWFSSLLGASFMGVVGSLMYMLMMQARWMTKAFASGTNGSYLTALVFALLTLMLMFSIPRLSNSIWDGISASFSRGAATAKMVGGAAIAVTTGGVGTAGMMAGGAVRGGTGMSGAIHRYSSQLKTAMPLGKRVIDAVRNRDSFAQAADGKSKVMQAMTGVHKVGGMARDLGYDMVMSQMPSAIQRVESRLGRGKTTRARAREQAAVRSAVSAVLGPDVAKAMPFSNTWRLSQRAGETMEAAAQRCAEGYIRTRKVEDQSTAVRNEAARLLGPERAHEFVLPDNFKLKTKRGRTDAEAATTAAIGLMKKQGLLSEGTQKQLEQKAIMDECVRMVGAEKASRIVMAPTYGVIKKKGQSWKEAMHGAAVNLLQKHDLIDKKDKNAIALRYQYTLARKRNQDKIVGRKNAAPKKGKGRNKK
jgi:hypothetical protein